MSTAGILELKVLGFCFIMNFRRVQEASLLQPSPLYKCLLVHGQCFRHWEDLGPDDSLSVTVNIFILRNRLLAPSSIFLNYRFPNLSTQDAISWYTRDDFQNSFKTSPCSTLTIIRAGWVDAVTTVFQQRTLACPKLPWMLVVG